MFFFTCAYIIIYIYMNGGRNHLFIFMPCANWGRLLSVVRISAFTDCEATHAKKGYRYVFSLCTLSQSREGHLISYDEIISCHIHAASKLRDAKRC